MRTWGLALALATSAFASSVHACVEYSFSPLFAEARIRGRDGVWRAAFIEAADKDIRIEYAHPRTPWGRLVVSGNVISGEALVFPIKISAPVPDKARVTWKTSLSAALPEVGLNDGFLEAPFASVISSERSARVSKFRGYECVFGYKYVGGAKDWAIDKSVCVHESGLPLFMNRADGRRVFEVERLVLQPRGGVPRVRFTAPAGYRLTDKKPEYLTGYTC
jgi:hypothetical protein